jgi:hypothetical protein
MTRLTILLVVVAGLTLVGCSHAPKREFRTNCVKTAIEHLFVCDSLDVLEAE